MYMCVHKIMNMYIHSMYMVQTCMNRFAHLCGGGRIPDVRTRTEQYKVVLYPDSYVLSTDRYVLSTYNGSRFQMRARMWAAPILSPSGRGRGRRRVSPGKWGPGPVTVAPDGPGPRLFVPHPSRAPEVQSRRRGPRPGTPPRPVDIPTAATASTALSADSAALTASVFRLVP